MNDPDLHHVLVGRLITTARAHHTATGGVNPQWAQWYAEYLLDDLNNTLGTDLETADLADWLDRADRRYNEESPDTSWPKAYATWLLDDFT